MNALLAIALSNLLVAALIAVIALLAGSLARRPALAHGLWLLFFLKLLTPPLLPVPIAWSMPTADQAGTEQPLAVELAPSPAQGWLEAAEPALRANVAAEAIGFVNQESPSQNIVLPAIREHAIREHSQPSGPPTEYSWADAWPGLWLTGSLCWLGAAATRLMRFRKQLRFALPAPADLRQQARHLADQMQVVCPQVWVLPGPLSPMLWVLGSTPRLLIPAGLLDRLDEEQRQALLVHELAHWRRRDHWVRWLELVALGLYWWCPLVWWARRQMQEAEEECCDAWVVWLMPRAARSYALALVETLDFMATAPAALPPVASGIGRVRLLKRRLTMIMRGTTPRALTLGGGLAVLGLGALLLPLMPSWAQSPPATFQPGAERADPNLSDKLQALEKAQQDIRRMQEELERTRRDLERRTRDLNLKMEQVKREAQEAAKSAPVERKSTPRGGMAPGTGGGAFGGGGVQMAPGAWSGSGQGGFGGPGGMGGGGFAFGGFPGGSPADLDKRLREVERKLDLLIQMMRQGARPGAPGFPGGPAAGALAPPNPLVPGPAGSRLITPADPIAPGGSAPRLENQPLPPRPVSRPPSPPPAENPSAP